MKQWKYITTDSKQVTFENSISLEPELQPTISH